ncbi:MAG TPA: SEC-C domain-containing protein [Planctomycetota bacterium]|nr:SEC-C domain-containing protein [Planctomycetota bacterium]
MPFFLVDRDLARDELLVLPIRVAGVSKQCLIIDAYCTAPKCACRNALLWFVESPAQAGNNATRPSPAALIEVIEDAWYGGSPLLEVLFDLKSEVFSTTEEQPHEILNEAVSDLRGRFTSAHVKLLREHRERVRAWGKDNPWHLKDWTSFEPDGCVSWTTLNPSAPLLTAFYEGLHHVFADMYCTNPDCRCEEVLLSVGRREARGGPAHELGCLRVSLQAAAEGDPRVETGDSTTLRGAYAELLASRPGVLSLFRRRKLSMREFGRFVETKRPSFDVRAPAAPRTFRPESSTLPTMGAARRSGLEAPGSRGFVSRNAPCPCGSGRKFKNCCAR